MTATGSLPAAAPSRPSGAGAVMAGRVEPPDSLDFFPTPPWATRALCEHVLGLNGRQPLHSLSAWEPAAGEGHMAEVLREYFGAVVASDVHDYGRGYLVGSFVGTGADRMACAERPDWIITNPPFSLALDFADRAIDEARMGVALLVRSVWAESEGRFRDLFEDRPPSTIAQFVERVPMVKGRWDPTASTATGYAWFVWRRGERGRTRFAWIPPGCRKRLTRPGDVARFAPAADHGPLFGGGEAAE